MRNFQILHKIWYFISYNTPLHRIRPVRAKSQMVTQKSAIFKHPYIINLSLRTNTLPEDFKVARVVPLYKKGDRNYVGNFRPVSILSVISKIIKELFTNRFPNILIEMGCYLTCKRHSTPGTTKFFYWRWNLMVLAVSLFSGLSRILVIVCNLSK